MDGKYKSATQKAMELENPVSKSISVTKDKSKVEFS